MGFVREYSRMGAGPVCLLALTVAMYWKLASGQYLWFDHPDAVNQILPWFQFQAREWRLGRFPLWDPHHWGGQSLPGQVQPGVFYPLNWLLFLSPLRDGFLTRDALNWYFIAIHFIGSWAGFALCRSLGSSLPAAVLGGVAYGLGGYMGSNEWPQMLNGACWAPVVFLFWIRTLQTASAREAVLAGASLGVAWLSGHHQAPTFITLGCLFAICWALITGRMAPWTGLRLTGLFTLSMLAVGAVQILPAYHYGHAALRWVGAAEPLSWSDRVPYPVHERYSLHPEGLAGLLFPNSPQSPGLFLGSALLFLTAQGIVAGWRDWRCRLVTAIGGFGFLLALGGSSVLHGVTYLALPMVEKARSPAAAVLLFSLAVAALAATGLDSLASPGGRARKQAALGFLAAGILLWLGLGVAVNVHPLGGLEYDRLMLAAMGLAATGAVTAAGSAGALPPRAVQLLLLGLVVSETATVTTFRLRHRDQASLVAPLHQDRDIAEFLRQRPVQRVSVDHDAVPYNFGDWFGFDELQGYAGVTANIFRSHDHRNAHRQLGANFHVGTAPPEPGSRILFESRRGVKVFDIPDAAPRARLHRDGSAAPACADPRPPERLSPRPGYVIVKFVAGCRALLAVSDTWAPGWGVTVDGAPARLLELNGFELGVAVEPGAHTVEFRYRPGDVYAGAALTLGGLFAAFFVAIMRRPAAGTARNPQDRELAA